MTQLVMFGRAASVHASDGQTCETWFNEIERGLCGESCDWK